MNDRLKYVLVLVDGFHESLFFKEVCPGVKVQRTNCNGKNVEIEAIAKRAASLYRSCASQVREMVLVVDREARVTSSDLLETELRAALVVEGVQCQIYLGVADRMIENWILADKEAVSGVAKISNESLNYPEHVDGLGGAAILKGLFRNYGKTTSGVEMLKRCRRGIIERSPSFHRFSMQIKDLFGDCWWYQRTA